MKNLPLRLLLVMAAILVVLFVMACQKPQAQPKEGSVFEEMLRLVPDTFETRQGVHINDIAQVRNLYHISLPGLGASEDELLDYLYKVKGQEGDSLRSRFRLADAPWISGFGGPYNLEVLGYGKYRGFDIRNVDQTVLAGAPPETLEIVKGRFAPSATEAAFKACSECEPPLRETYRDVPFYSWGDDFEVNFDKRLAPPAYDELGRGGRIAVMENYVRRTLDTQGMQLLLRTSLEKANSLAEVEDFRLLARGLGRMGAFAGLFTDQTQGREEVLETLLEADLEAGETLMSSMESDPLLKPYQAMAIGTGSDKEGLYMVLVLVHADKEGALKNVELLKRRVQEASSLGTKRPWKESVTSLDIQVEGNVLRAKLYGDIALSWLNWYYMRDPLLLHE